MKLLLKPLAMLLALFRKEPAIMTWVVGVLVNLGARYQIELPHQSVADALNGVTFVLALVVRQLVTPTAKLRDDDDRPTSPVPPPLS